MTGPNPESIAGVTVREMWRSDGWNLPLLKQLLPDDVSDLLAATKITTEPVIDDKVFWRHTSNGVFTTSSALASLRADFSPLAPPTFWKRIWRFDCQQRPKKFLYILAHNVVLTNERLFHKHMTNDPLCKNALLLSLRSMIRDCAAVHHICLAITGTTPPSSFFTSSSTYDWIAMKVNMSDDWAGLFSNVVWLLWKSRNELCFTGIDSLPSVTCRAIKQLMAYGDAKAKRPHTATPASPLPQTWLRPLASWFKINVDGSSIGNPGSVGGGGIVRNDGGLFCNVFCFNGYYGTTLYNGLLACWYGLLLAADMGLRRIILESDCADAVKLLRRGT